MYVRQWMCLKDSRTRKWTKKK